MSDLRYALRMLLKSPGFSLIVIATLALGIGANSAIFSVVDAVLLRPLPFPDPDQLVMVWRIVAQQGGGRDVDSYPNYVDFRAQTKTLKHLAAFRRMEAVLAGNEEARALQGVAITSDIFDVLGVSPFLGRRYTRAEDNVDARVVVLTYEGWQRAFAGDPNIVGRQVSLPRTLHDHRRDAARVAFSRAGFGGRFFDATRANRPGGNQPSQQSFFQSRRAIETGPVDRALPKRN